MIQARFESYYKMDFYNITVYLPAFVRGVNSKIKCKYRPGLLLNRQLKDFHHVLVYDIVTGQ